MILNIIFLILGFVVLIKGADFFVDGASSVAGRLKVPKMLIGLTIVAFGTSAPEFAVSVQSILSGSGDIVIGNVVGSNILNILLILGVASMFHFLNVKDNTVKKELPIVVLMTLMFAALMCDELLSGMPNVFARGDGIALVLTFGVFIYYLIKMAKNGEKEKGKPEDYMKLPKAVLFTIGGIVAIVVGSQLVVNGASGIAAGLGVSERMIALTVVALGTSLPELVTSVTATRKGEYDIAIGNVVGSNIFNIGIVLGIPVALFGTIPNVTFNYIDIAVMILAAVLLYLFARNDRKITRVEGVVMLSVFVAYYSYVIYSGMMI